MSEPKPKLKPYEQVKAEAKAAGNAVLEKYADQLFELNERGWSLRQLAEEIGTSYELVRTLIDMKKKEVNQTVMTPN